MRRWSGVLMAVALLSVSACQDEPTAPEPSFAKQPPPPPLPFSPAVPELLPNSQGTRTSFGYAISPQGWVLGTYYKLTGGVLTLSWDPATLADAIVADPSSIYSGANASGDVAAHSNGPAVFLASPNTGRPYAVRSLRITGGVPGNWIARGISDARVVVGTGEDPASMMVVWLPSVDASGVVTYPELPIQAPLPTSAYPQATFYALYSAIGINNVGVIAGTIRVGAESVSPSRAFLWRVSGSGTAATVQLVQELPAYPGATASSAQDINEAGTVFGVVRISDTHRPALWSPDADGVYRAAPMVLMAVVHEGGIFSSLDRCGRVASYGRFGGSRSTSQAYVWDGRSDPVLLRRPDGSYDNRAHDINAAGDVVGATGFSSKGQITWRATRWLGAVPPCTQ